MLINASTKESIKTISDSLSKNEHSPLLCVFLDCSAAEVPSKQSSDLELKLVVAVNFAFYCLKNNLELTKILTSLFFKQPNYCCSFGFLIVDN